MYFEYFCSPPIDIINYENICAKNMYVWGRFTESQIRKYVPSDVELKCIGNPMMDDSGQVQEEVNIIYILLPRRLYIKQVDFLMSILPSEYQYLIRPHPSLKEYIIENYIDGIKFKLDSSEDHNELMKRKKYTCVITFNSTCVFQSLYWEQKTLYFDSCSEIDASLFNSFTNQQELISLINSRDIRLRYEKEYFFAKYNKGLLNKNA
jgi:hypothetical protein